MAINTPKISYNSIDIEFDFPPSGDFRDENISVNGTESRSNNGKSQMTVNYMENTSSLEFTFVSEALKIKLDAFFTDWALQGKSFDYYEDKTLPGFKTVYLSAKTYKPEILFPANVANEYVYKFKISMRSVI